MQTRERIYHNMLFNYFKSIFKDNLYRQAKKARSTKKILSGTQLFYRSLVLSHYISDSNVSISDHWQKSEIAISANWKISKMNFVLLKNKPRIPVYFLEWQAKNFAKDWTKFLLQKHAIVTKNVSVTKRVNVNKNANVTNSLNFCTCKINSI